MITTLKDIYLKLSEEYKLPRALIESIGDMVFHHARECLDDPMALGVELKKLGTFNLIQPSFIEYVRRYESSKSSPLSDSDIYRERLERYKKLVREIDRFKREKAKKRNERYKPS